MVTQQQLPYEGLLAESLFFPGHNGEPIGGYLARPLGPGPFPGVIVIQEIFGLVPHIKEMARRFAASGYIAIAPDLYWREGFTDAEAARAGVQAMGGIPDSRVVGDLDGAAALLRTLPSWNGRTGCTGYCAGGRWTLLFACNTNSLSAGVDCYGGNVVTTDTTPNRPVPVVTMVQRLSCPLLGLFGEEDQNPSPAQTATLDAELRKYNKTFEFHTYPDAGHAFFADYRPSYRQAAAVDGWEKKLAWFERYLVPSRVGVPGRV